MLRFACLLSVSLVAMPAVAQDDAPSLMERGMEMFLDGLLEELDPALEEMLGLLDDAGPALRGFMQEMGPAFRDLMDEVEDWSRYEAPEVLENGDIIIRRKPEPRPEAEEIEI